MHKIGKVSDLRLLLHSISEELVTDELESLKYLCSDILTRAKLEKIGNAKQLFVAIAEVIEGEEKQLELLIQLFESISRRDLKSKVQQFQESRIDEVRDAGQHMQNADIDPGVNNTDTPAPLQSYSGRVVPIQPEDAFLQPGSSVEMPHHVGPLQSNSGRVVPNQTREPFEQPGPLVGMPSVGPLQSNPGRVVPYQPGQPFVQPGPSVGISTVGPLQQQYQSQRKGSLLSIAEDRPSPGVLPQTAQQNSGHLLTDSSPHGSERTTDSHGPYYTALADIQLTHIQPSHFSGSSQDLPRGLPSQDAALKYPIPQDDLGELPLLQYSAGKNSVPQDSAEKYPFLQESSAEKYTFSQGSARKYPFPEDSAGKNQFPQDSAGKYHEHPEHPVPFSQQEESPQTTEEVEQLNHKIVELVTLPEKTTTKPFAWGHLPSNSEEAKPRNGMIENIDQPNKGSLNIASGRPSDSLTVSTRSEYSAFPGQQEKVPVERCISTDFNDAAYQCLQQKCPVEMSYDSIKGFFPSGAKVLGKGGFGVVYEGTNTFHGQRVVIKEEYTAHLGQAYSAAQLKREKRVGYIKHPHLMPLYAFSEERGKPCCLMYPKMHSDLHKALRLDSNGRQKLPWESRVRIALHTARALQYLHTEVTNERNVRQEIVHMDVKPGNIFLDEDFNARLGDPGMAQELPMGFSFASISQIRGTEGYLDEYLSGRHFKPINDIFSFGVVLLELLTQRKAVEITSRNKNEPLYHVLQKEGVLSNPESLMAKARKSVWPDSGDDEKYTKEFAAVAIDCLRPLQQRAKLSDVCQRLERILWRKGIVRALKPKEGTRCLSCLLNHPAKHLAVRSPGCDRMRSQKCNHFCVTCLTQARRNPLECPSHGPAEPEIGGSDMYAVLICGNDPDVKRNAAVFERDLCGIESVLTDSRIVGIRRDHMFCIKPPLSCDISQAAEVRKTLGELKQKLHGKKDVFLWFYFSGHSDLKGNLICSSDEDVLTEVELKEHLHQLKDNVGEFLIILDCCFADGKIASAQLEDEAFLVHKSLDPAEETEEPSDWQHPMESLCNKLHSGEDSEADKEPISSAAEQSTETDHDTWDGNVICKAPLVHFTVRQWSSSLREQQSYGMAKGNSFLTQYIICGLRGAHTCPFAKPSCRYCETFKTQAKSLGYISAANLEVFISKHVERAASKAGRLSQRPRIRSLHSSETILAYYNEGILCDEIIFRSTTDDSNKIAVDNFPILLEEFQKQMFSKVKDKLPNCAQPKHLQILCDDEEIVQETYVDLQDFIRQGYDVRLQLRPCSSIIYGPVVLPILNYRDLVLNLLSCLQLMRRQEVDTFEVDTSQRRYATEDVKECLEDDASHCSDLKDTSLGNSIVEILTTTNLYHGVLTICVLVDSLDCSFFMKATT